VGYFSGSGAYLSIAAPDATGGESRISLLSLAFGPPTVENGIAMWSAVPARLTTEGMQIFNNVYSADEPFEPVTIRALSL
jgi:hypothetical protein